MTPKAGVTFRFADGAILWIVTSVGSSAGARRNVYFRERGVVTAHREGWMMAASAWGDAVDEGRIVPCHTDVIPRGVVKENRLVST